MPNKIVNPGDFIVTSLVLKNTSGVEIDLRPNLLEFTLHESVYQNFLSGEILIGENVDLKRNFPLIGYEFLEISFKTSSRDNKISHKFFVYKIEPPFKLNNTNKATAYHMRFCSIGCINDSRQKISKSFSNLSFSEIIKSIYSISDLDSDKNVDIYPSLGKKHIVLPYMHPSEAFNWIASKTIGDDGTYTYMFYETVDSYCFKPINFSKNPVATYTQFPPNLTYQSSYKDIESDMKRIELLSIEKNSNTLENLSDGVFSSKIITYDPIYKNISSKTFSYNSDFKKLNTLYKNGILPNSESVLSNSNDSFRVIYPKHSYQFDNIKDSSEYENYILERYAHINHFKNNKISIVVSGDSNRRAGDMINVNILSGQIKKENTNPFDYYMSGKYIITKVTHILQQEKYTMRFDLERDSLPNNYPDIKVFK